VRATEVSAGREEERLVGSTVLLNAWLILCHEAVQINQPNRPHRIKIHSIYVLSPTPATRWNPTVDGQPRQLRLVSARVVDRHRATSPLGGGEDKINTLTPAPATSWMVRKGGSTTITRRRSSKEQDTGPTTTCGGSRGCVTSFFFLHISLSP
jgi:hypothetical protein